MNPDAIREVLALHVAGHPLESVSFGATVTIICGNEVSAARWRSRTPNGRLPVSGVDVQVVCMEAVEGARPRREDGPCNLNAAHLPHRWDVEDREPLRLTCPGLVIPGTSGGAS